MKVYLSDTRDIRKEDILAIYRSLEWSSAEKPNTLYNALLNSHSLVTAWDNGKLVGLGNAISDGYLVVYYPHLAVLPEYQGQGIGTRIVKSLLRKYKDFHQQVLVADGRAIEFYKKCGFKNTGKCRALWIYPGNDHEF